MIPANAASPAPKGEYDREQLRHADADDPRHVRIVDAGANHGSQPGAIEEEPQTDGNDEGNDNDRQPVIRENENAETRKSGEFRRRCHRERIAAPHHETKVGGHKGQTKRHQHLGQLIARQSA